MCYLLFVEFHRLVCCLRICKVKDNQLLKDDRQLRHSSRGLIWRHFYQLLGGPVRGGHPGGPRVARRLAAGGGRGRRERDGVQGEPRV